MEKRGRTWQLLMPMVEEMGIGFLVSVLCDFWRYVSFVWPTEKVENTQDTIFQHFLMANPYTWVLRMLFWSPPGIKRGGHQQTSAC